MKTYIITLLAFLSFTPFIFAKETPKEPDLTKAFPNEKLEWGRKIKLYHRF